MSSKNQQHLSREQLHTFVRGELDPARRAVVEAHLDECEACAKLLEQVAGVTQLFEAMSEGELDDLRWRRIREAVRAQLEADARQPITVDVTSGRRWILPSVAAAAAVGLMVWGTVDRRNDARHIESSPARADAQQLASGGAPLEVTLASGAQLQLAPQTVVRAARPTGPQLELDLVEGALTVQWPAPPVGPTRLRTPAFEVEAASDHFSAGFWADRYFIDIKSGRAVVRGADFGAGTELTAGQRRDVTAAIETKPAPSKPMPVPAAPQDEVPRPAKRRTRPKPPQNRPVPAPRKAPTADAPPVAKRPATISKSTSGTVTVQMEAPASPVFELWRRTNDAYYRQRDLDEAVRLAAEVVALGGPQAYSAQQLLCDAHIARGDGPAALKTCSALLDRAQSEEERRNIHYTVGTIYRSLLKDCRQAIEHYNQALVFGRQHLLDDEVRIARASCALDIGEIDLAERDIGSLSARAGRLARPQEVTRLQRKLTAAKRRTHDDTVTTD